MKKPLLQALLLAGLSPLALPQAAAQVFPEAIDYVMQLQSSVQSNSNPGQMSEARGSAESSTVLVNTLGVAASIPLLSRETRLDVAGTIGDARFNGLHQLDYRPRSLDTTLHWRAGRLFSGQVGYQYQHERHESDQRWPDGDTVSTRRWEAQAGMHVTHDLTLPLVRFYDERTRYGALPNQQLFDRDEKGWEVSGRYQSATGSSVSAGFGESRTTLPLRHTLARIDLDDAYRDREVFTQVYWQYSSKTSVMARVGWLQRRYANFPDRDTRLLTLDTEAIWRYSPKTELRLGLWQRPYHNDEDPDISYSVRTGGGLTANWRATAKLALSLRATYEKQRDKRFDGQSENSPRLHFGSRLTWNASPNLDVILDGYHTRKRGDDLSDRYTQNVVRVGIVLYTDSGNSQVAPLLNPLACNWSYVEASLCP